MSTTSNPVHSSLLPPFGSAHASHLPTPQSPNTITAYTGNIVESPTAVGLARHELSKLHQLEQEHANASAPSLETIMTSGISHHHQPPHNSNFMTPESSPQMVRTRIPPAIESCAEDFIPPLKSASLVKSESPDFDFASSSLINPAPVTAPHSCLSSPFTERLSLGGRTPTKSGTPRRDLARSRSPAPTPLDDVFFQPPSIKSPPLAAPLPQRLRDEETEQIRLLLTDPELTRIQDTESHRPGYLIHVERTLDVSEKARGHPLDGARATTPPAGIAGSLDIAVTPIQGRRLKLFQETSEESFEESLMVNGYGYGGSTSLAREGSSDQLSQHTLEWLQQRSPGVILPPSRLNPSLQETLGQEPLTDKELKKRKRMAAFRTTSARTKVEPSKLVPVEVEGRGRLLLNIDERELFREGSEQDIGHSKRSGSRRKRKGVESIKASPSKRKGRSEDQTDQDSDVNGPDWLDSEFPWCLKVNERAEMIKEDEEERMIWIERFLDRDTDEEESEEEEIMPSVSWGEIYEHPPMPSRKGRGKMVPIKGEQGSKGNMFFPSDPADARAALLSKRAVRALAQRRAKRSEDDPGSDAGSDAEEEVCVCGRKNDSRGLVQCDDCERWYHLRCVGIKTVAELGGDDDPWYCSGCAHQRRSITPELQIPSSEPTMVPTDDDHPANPSNDPLFFNGSLEESPLPTWTVSAPPTTPIRGRNLLEQFSISGSSSPSKGPHTPYSSSTGVARVYATPGFHGDMDGAETNFDPTSTPSRGIKFGAAYATPKNSSAWSNNRMGTGGLFQTPLRSNATLSSSSRSHWMDDSGSASYSSPVPRFSNHDTPARRKEGGARIQGLSMSSRRLFESPMVLGGSFGGRYLGGGGFNHPSIMLDDSPVVRSAGKKRLREEADLGDGIPE